MITDPVVIQALKKDPLAVWLIVSKAISITEFVEYQTGNVFCVFHEDTNKPSAVFYLDEPDGIDKFHCYTCGKQYTSYDYIKKILELRPIDYLLANISDLMVKGLLIEGANLNQSINEDRKHFINGCWDKSNKSIGKFLSLVYND